MKDETGAMRPIGPAEIRVRQKIRAERLHGAVFAALFLGISLACLGLGLVQTLRNKPNMNTP